MFGMMLLIIMIVFFFLHLFYNIINSRKDEVDYTFLLLGIMVVICEIGLAIIKILERV